MKILDFDPNSKDNWGDLQKEISDLIPKALALKEGFIVCFARRASEEAKKILAIMKKPTVSQRGYYWAVVIPTIRKAAAEQEQHFKSDEHVHSVLKNILMEEHSLYEELMNPITGEIYKECFSISDAKGSKANTAKFIDTVINWAAGFYGIEIPSPPSE
jgi:hypothetical protein